jgi:hypothetical protein
MPEPLLQAVTAVRTAQDYVKLPGYRALAAPTPSATAIVREYRDEKDFWADVLGYSDPARRPRAGELIVLHGFRLSAWVPRVPGLFWKVESLQLRAAARGERLAPGAGLGLYTPVGKTLQVLGGIGNVRLLPSATGRVICASSSGYYWRGVPVLVQDQAWQMYGDVEAGLEVDLRGVWSPMPREYAQALGGDAGIPRYCLAVSRHDDITPRKEAWPGSSSAWSLFEYRGSDDRLRYDFVYCTFEINRRSPLRRPTEEDAHNTDEAAEFLRDYLRQYHGEALTDFDEEMPHFNALLPISELMSQQVDAARLRAFVDRVKQRALSPETVRYDRLPQLLMQHFNSDELRILVSDYLGVELEHLVGQTAGLAEQVDALVSYCEQQDRLEDLVVGVAQERPQTRGELTV